MLRASLRETGTEIDLRSLGNASIDPGRSDAAALIRFTSALVSRTPDLADARDALISALGPESVAPAASAAGNFEMMNRILDAAGVRKPSLDQLLPEIGLPPDWH